MLPAAGVPAKVAVSSPLSTKVTPEGKEPDSESAMSGVVVLPSVAVMVKVPAVPTVKLVLSAEVIVGDPGSTVMSSPPSLVLNGQFPLPIVPETVTEKGLSPAEANVAEFVDVVELLAPMLWGVDTSVDGSPANWPAVFGATVEVNVTGAPQELLTCVEMVVT